MNNKGIRLHRMVIGLSQVEKSKLVSLVVHYCIIKDSVSSEDGYGEQFNEYYTSSKLLSTSFNLFDPPMNKIKILGICPYQWCQHQLSYCCMYITEENITICMLNIVIAILNSAWCNSWVAPNR